MSMSTPTSVLPGLVCTLAVPMLAKPIAACLSLRAAIISTPATECCVAMPGAVRVGWGGGPPKIKIEKLPKREEMQTKVEMRFN